METSIYAINLAKQHITNLNKEDITGEVYDRLKAIRPTDKRDVTGSIVWEFECECGNKIELSVGAFRSGRVHSCGCLYKESRADCNSYRKDFIDNTCLSSIVTAKKPNARNSSGYTGVYFDKRSGKWHAYINFQKKRYNLGLFKDIHDAIKARKIAEERIHDPIIIEHWEALTKARKQDFIYYLIKNKQNPL